MSYATGTYTSSNDLAAQLATFLGANGWTLNRNELVVNWRRIHAQKNGIFINIRSVNSSSTGQIVGGSWPPFNALAGYPSDGYDNAQPFESQPGKPTHTPFGSMLTSLDTSGTFYFFAYPDSDDVFIVVEYTPGRFQMMTFGRIAKFDAEETRLEYFYATAPYSGFTDTFRYELFPFLAAANNAINYCGTSVRFANSVADQWVKPAYGVDGVVSNSVFDEQTTPWTTNSFSWHTAFIPVNVFIRVGHNLRPLGEIKNLRRLDVSKHTPASVITLGPDSWMAFPYLTRASGQYNGYAIKKVL